MSQTIDWTGIDRNACLAYVFGRQTDEGGFCFYAHRAWGVQDPNAPDTYAALAVLRRLEVEIPDRATCTAWLSAQQQDDGGYATLTIGAAALRALRLLGCAPRRDPRSWLLRTGATLGMSAGALDLAPRLTSVLRCLALWQMFGLPVSASLQDRLLAALERLRSAEGGYGLPAAHVPETAAASALRTHLGLAPEPTAVAYVRRCERLPYGFNISSESNTSNLLCQWSGTRVLQGSGVSPRFPGAVRSYVALCQTAVGGFGRAPGAIARLDDTMRAVGILDLLVQPGERAGPRGS